MGAMAPTIAPVEPPVHGGSFTYKETFEKVSAILKEKGIDFDIEGLPVEMLVMGFCLAKGIDPDQIPPEAMAIIGSIDAREPVWFALGTPRISFRLDIK